MRGDDLLAVPSSAAVLEEKHTKMLLSKLRSGGYGLLKVSQ